MNQTDTNIFYLPMAYLHRIRLERAMGRILSWWGLLIVPTLGYSLLLNDGFSACDGLAYLLLIAAVVAYYELGYMYNDTYTTRREAKPTLRLTAEQSEYFYQHEALIVGIRMSMVVILLAAYGWLSNWSLPTFITIGATLLLLPLFALYNRVRGLSSVLLYPLLVGWRYTVFLLPYLGNELWLLCFGLLLVAYPLEISIERWSMPGRRYGFMARVLPNEESKTRFRACYYAIVLLLLIPLWVHQSMLNIPILLIGCYRWARQLAARINKK